MILGGASRGGNIERYNGNITGTVNASSIETFTIKLGTKPQAVILFLLGDTTNPGAAVGGISALFGVRNEGSTSGSVWAANLAVYSSGTYTTSTTSRLTENLATNTYVRNV